MLRWLIQPGKESRAAAFIEKKERRDGFLEVTFAGIPETFYYPENASWIDLCQTIDEVFNPKNWHHFISDDVPLTSEDVVVDCGAAEGLFSFFSANRAARVYAIEPVPLWHPGLERTFAPFSHVELLKVGVGHRDAELRMTDDEIYSRIDPEGTLVVPVRTLDSLFIGRDLPVSFIKADIEGFEFPMLLGAEEVIRLNRPKISVTVYHDTDHHVEMREFLRHIHRDYRFRTRGIAENGNPVLLQAF